MYLSRACDEPDSEHSENRPVNFEWSTSLARANQPEAQAAPQASSQGQGTGGPCADSARTKTRGWETLEGRFSGIPLDVAGPRYS